ncbi:MAG: cysteine--tRNA ligase [Methyloligellaceae bacterium]
MPITLYNTLTRNKQELVPLNSDNVRMYVCGPTVYDFAHIGNARPIIVFDTLFQLLRHTYGDDKVTYARNITDVDDKINQRAFEEGISIRELTEKTADQFHQDIAALGCQPPTVEPRATDHIEEMKQLIEQLVERGHAYVAEDHVLFEVSSMADYGKLSGRSLEDMEAGARVEVAPYKKDPMDFVLWKPSKENEPGWNSPCNIKTDGRPGWHIECSAMSAKHLGETFDIHGGGIDLVFPHHENELAQSRCGHASDKMANIWMHNGFLQVEGEKMSKSLGNFITINELLQDWHGEALRLTMLMTHYRKPINWTAQGVTEAKQTLNRWYETIGDIEGQGEISPVVLAALEDDLNTPAAITALHELRDKAVNDKEAALSLKASANLLGLLHHTNTQWKNWRPSSVDINETQIEAMIVARNDAKKAKDFAEADRIRTELTDMGIALKDGPEGTTWEIAG